ncbi:MAG: response regulator transcription factor [Flavobacteriales bacterium]|nr:response regulator transcription factor [Flavobacteriales bacterium]
MEAPQTIKLLVVDNNELIIEAIQNVLKNSNHINIVGNCFDGNEAISFLKSNKTDVILIDIMMGKVSGFEAVKRIKSYNSKIKVIGFSLINHAYFVNEIMLSGADGFISKYNADKELMEKEIYRVMNL